MGRRVRAAAGVVAWSTAVACQFGSAGQGDGSGQRPARETDPAPDVTDASGDPIPDGTGSGAGGTGDADTGTSAAPPTTDGPPAMTGDTSDTSDPTGDTGTGVLPTDCAQILGEDPDAESGVFVIAPPGGAGAVEVHCDMVTDGGGWTRFWWWTPGEWPAAVTDVLQSPFGTCAVDAPYCFARLPALAEDDTSLYAFDPQSITKYRWDFDSTNPTAHAAWRAFAEHVQVPAGEVQHGTEWPPIALEGSPAPDAAQNSFMYRTEHGVASILLDDDNCDCETTLQMGHGMCYGGWGTGSSPENSYGVDRLHNPGVETGPRPDFHLELYYR